MNNQEVAHLWNAQSRPRAKGSHFYFEGPTIYSYGPHFPIATIHTRKRDSLVLFTARDCSVTTSKHKSCAARACSNRPTIVVPHITPRCHGDHAANLNALAQRQQDALQTAQRRIAEWRVESDRERAMHALSDYALYCEFFGIRRKPLPMLEQEFEAAIARARRIENPNPASADKRERARAQRVERNRERDEYMDAHRANLARGRFYADMARRTDWRLHGAFGTGYHQQRDSIMLRVNGDQIETSWSARVPVAAAPKVWRYVERIRQGGGTDYFEDTGVRLRIGDYRVDRVDSDGTLHAGCHTIPHSELAAMARMLGLS